MKKQRNIPKAFIVFLIASLFFWALIKLSKEYTTTVNYPVIYGDLPQDKLFQKDPIKSIDLLLKGSGFKLLTANFNKKEIQLSVGELEQKSKTTFSLTTLNQRIEIQKQMPSGLQLEQIKPAIITIELGSLLSKKVPVIENIDIEYGLGFNLSEDLKIEPDSILISGPELQLKNISSLLIEKITLQNVSKDFKQSAKIIVPNEIDNIKYQQKEVIISGIVDKFTEGEFEVPFTIQNIPFGMEINTFPKTVKVIYKVGLKNFNKVTKGSFTVTCDYNDVGDGNLSYLIPKLKTTSTFVTSTRVAPNKIEYLIHK